MHIYIDIDSTNFIILLVFIAKIAIVLPISII